MMKKLITSFLLILLAGPGSRAVDAATFFHRRSYVGRGEGCTKSDLKEFVRNLYGGGAMRVVFTGIHPLHGKRALAALAVSWRMPTRPKERDYVLRLARSFVINHIDPQAEWNKLYPDIGQKTESIPFGVNE